MSAKTTIDSVRMDMIAKMLIPIPDIKEQRKIASILSIVDSQIQNRQEQRSKLETLKKGLMQKLLTGKIRVKI
jgi:type I restriction enzyme S subunit